MKIDASRSGREGPRGSRSERVYARLLRAYPEAFRAEYGAEMLQLFRDCRRRASVEGSGALVRLWLGVLADLTSSVARERLDSLDRAAAATPPAGRNAPTTMEGPMAVAIAAIVVGILLEFGAVQEFYVAGIQANQSQPVFVGLVGAVASLLLVVAGIAMIRGWRQRRNLMLVSAVLNVVFLVYSALPPHRNVGILALVLGAGMSCLLAFKALGSGPPEQKLYS